MLPVAEALGLIAAMAPAAADGVHRFIDPSVLGTRMTIVAVGGERSAARAAQAIRAEIDRLDAILSSWRPDSELSRLNRSTALAVSPDLFAVVEAAEAMGERTAGAYSGRLGRVIEAWSGERVPDRGRVFDLAQSATAARIGLDPDSHAIVRPKDVVFALDGLAKGYVVDRALEAGLGASPGLAGLMVEIGGDLRCAGRSPDGAWLAGIPDLTRDADNAPLAEVVDVSDLALATSGRGPRDRLIAGQRFSPTVSPFDGWPVEGAVGASVIAATTAEADARATAALVSQQQEPGLAIRLVTEDGGWATAQWDARSHGAELIRAQARAGAPWHDRWQALATFTAPRRQLIRDPDFRSPYMAMWISDLNNKPVRTLILVGTKVLWQRDNFIWWGTNRPTAERLVSVRSMSTSGAGVYNVFWDGVDDNNKTVPRGKYILHVETSRERGKHTYRNMTLDFTNATRHRQELAATEEGGGIVVTFDRY